VTRAHLPSRLSRRGFASRRLTKARCNERSHSPRCWCVGLRDPDSDPDRCSDSSLRASLKQRFVGFSHLALAYSRLHLCSVHSTLPEQARNGNLCFCASSTAVAICVGGWMTWLVSTREICHTILTRRPSPPQIEAIQEAPTTHGGEAGGKQDHGSGSCVHPDFLITGNRLEPVHRTRRVNATATGLELARVARRDEQESACPT
jgi:hypothetical protein